MYNPQLKTFLCVADAGSFNKAAEQMYITPPAVLKQIRLLESSLGEELFIRSSKGLELTAAGKSLYTDAKQIIQLSEDARERVKTAADRENRTIRVSVCATAPANLLRTMWPEIQKSCPDLIMQMVPFEDSYRSLLDVVMHLGQRTDMMFVVGVYNEGLVSYWDCDGMLLAREKMCCAVSYQHPLAAKEKLTIQDLYGQSIILLNRGENPELDTLRNELEACHPQVRIKDCSIYNMELFNRCESSNDMLVGIESWSNVHPMMRMIPVEWEHYMSTGIVYAHESREPMRRFLQAIKTVLGRQEEKQK